jgi:hypothetical protein
MDIGKFIQAKYSARTEDVKVPDLSEYFADDAPAVWTVKGLTAVEVAKTKLAYDRTETARALIGALANNPDKIEAVTTALGLTGTDVPQDVSRRIESLMLGSVSPKIDPDSRDAVVKLAETFPVIFYELTNKIDALTGQGQEPGKPKPSGTTPA